MALRQIREIGDEILLKISKPVTAMTKRTEELIEDMMSLIASFSGKLYGMRSKKKAEGKNKT